MSIWELEENGKVKVPFVKVEKAEEQTLENAMKQSKELQQRLEITTNALCEACDNDLDKIVLLIKKQIDLLKGD